MAVYEDDPRLKPGRKPYGGSTNRSAAPRGPLQKGSASTESKVKTDPRMPDAPKVKGADRPEWRDFDWRPPAPTNSNLKEASPWIDASIRQLMKTLSPGTALLEKRDRKGQSKVELPEMIRIQRSQDRRHAAGPDQGIYVTPPPKKQGAQMMPVNRNRLPDWNGET